MSDIFKFPGKGNDVVIFRKKDILDCIDANITDKEVLDEIITQCEFDAQNFIEEGRWTGIPYMGNIRLNPINKKLRSLETVNLINDAKEVLPKEEFLLFKSQLTKDTAKHIKAERIYNYMLSRAVIKHRRYYDKAYATKGMTYARLSTYLLSTAKPHRPLDEEDFALEEEIFLNNEQQTADRQSNCY